MPPRRASVSIDVCGELHMMFTEHIMQGKGKKDVEKMIEEEEIDEDAGAIVEGAEPFSLRLTTAAKVTLSRRRTSN